MNKYTAVVLLPDFLQDVYGTGSHYHARVTAGTAEQAARAAEAQAAEWFGEEVSSQDPTDIFRTLAVFAGHLDNLLDS